MSFHYHVAETDGRALAEAEEPMAQYLQVFRESASAWEGRSWTCAGYSAHPRRFASAALARMPDAGHGRAR